MNLSDLDFFQRFAKMKQQDILKYLNNLQNPELLELRNICIKVFIELFEMLDSDDFGIRLSYMQQASEMGKEELEGNLRFFRGILMNRLIGILKDRIYNTDDTVQDICDNISEILGI